jgi:hypothetical protein
MEDALYYDERISKQLLISEYCCELLKWCIQNELKGMQN